jgi:hypothetical protein
MHTMKIILGWLCDPCVHLIGIGLLVVHLIVAIGPDPDWENQADQPIKCLVCGATHEAGARCPMLAVQRDILPAAQ